MKNSTHIIFAILLVFLFFAVPFQATRAQTPQPVVRAVLFHSSTCGACHFVLTEVLPPLFEQYGQQLEIFMVEISSTEGRALFLDAVEKMGSERAAVPFLVVGDRYFIGTVDIPEQFPPLIEEHLAQGGLSWPDLPGLTEYMAAARETQVASLLPPQEITLTEFPVTVEPLPGTVTPALPATPTTSPPVSAQTDDFGSKIRERISRDPVGNSLAILVLLGILISLGWSALYLLRKPGSWLTSISSSSILVLCLLGLGVAGYLTYVETSHVQAYCGLVGDCNTVQQSEYARLFGFLPVGLLGMVGYMLIIAAWVGNQSLQGKWGHFASLAMLLLTVFATLFSLYLTFLEPFVIGATCLWCLSSAVISTILMLLSVPPGKLAFVRLIARQD